MVALAQIAERFAQTGMVYKRSKYSVNVEKLKKPEDGADACSAKPRIVGRFGKFVVALKMRNKAPPKQNAGCTRPAK